MFFCSTACVLYILDLTYHRIQQILVIINGPAKILFNIHFHHIGTCCSTSKPYIPCPIFVAIISQISRVFLPILWFGREGSCTKSHPLSLSSHILLCPVSNFLCGLTQIMLRAWTSCNSFSGSVSRFINARGDFLHSHALKI